MNEAREACGTDEAMIALEVKQQNDFRLHQMGAPVNPSLPAIEEPSELHPKTAQDVAYRAWALSYVTGVGYGCSGEEMFNRLGAVELDKHLTFREQKFLHKTTYTKSDLAWAAWQAEAVYGCAWALGLVDLDPLVGCPDDLASHFRPDLDPRPSIRAARLRSFEEIYVQADLHYRLHWAARQARLDGTAFPLPEVAIQLRRHSLDWIVGLPYDWDDMPLDT